VRPRYHLSLCPASYRSKARFAKNILVTQGELCLFAPTLAPAGVNLSLFDNQIPPAPGSEV